MAPVKVWLVVEQGDGQIPGEVVKIPIRGTGFQHPSGNLIVQWVPRGEDFGPHEGNIVAGYVGEYHDPFFPASGIHWCESKIRSEIRNLGAPIIAGAGELLGVNHVAHLGLVFLGLVMRGFDEQGQWSLRRWCLPPESPNWKKLAS